MSASTAQYAELANRAYDTRHVTYGAFGPRGDGHDVVVDGVTFVVRERIRNSETGYQGVIFQRQDTGELVVAHKGTQNRGDVEIDYDMVVNRVNDQSKDALTLTQRALDLAKERGVDKVQLPVTVTGHSLGGALAEITAHRFGLHGETFNSYGAVSLDRKYVGASIPEGGHAVINHVMAGDAISAASPHYGEVRVYASEHDVRTLAASGFGRGVLHPVTVPPVAAALTYTDHGIHNFLPYDKNGHPHSSVLNPQAQKLALDNRQLISQYRGEVGALRANVTFMATFDHVAGQPLPEALKPVDHLGARPPAREAHRNDPAAHANHLVSPLQHDKPLHGRQVSQADEDSAHRPLSETDLLVRHNNPVIVAFHDRVQSESTLAAYSETERSRIAAAIGVACEKTGRDLAGMTVVGAHDYQGRTMFTADDPVRAARTPYTSFATVYVDKAIDTPVQDSLNQMQTTQMAQAQELAQRQSQGQSGPVMS